MNDDIPPSPKSCLLIGTLVFGFLLIGGLIFICPWGLALYLAGPILLLLLMVGGATGILLVLWRWKPPGPGGE